MNKLLSAPRVIPIPNKYHLKLEWDYTPELYALIFAIKRTVETNVPTVRLDIPIERNDWTTYRPDTFLHHCSLMPLFFDPRLLNYTEQDVPSYQSMYPTEYELSEMNESGRPSYLEKFPNFIPPVPMEDFPFHEFGLSDRQVLWFKVDVHCKFNEVTQTWEDKELTGEDFVWIPIGNQLEWISEEQRPRIVGKHRIKLSEGARICYFFGATKGQPKEYTGFSNCRTRLNYYVPEELNMNNHAINPEHNPMPCPPNTIQLTLESLNELDPWYYYEQAIIELRATFQSMSNDLVECDGV